MLELPAVAEASAHSDSVDTGYLPTPYQQQIHQSKYARWREDLGRRETWEETVARLMDYYRSHCEERGTFLPESLWAQLHTAILNQDVLPSMRALMTAGPALKRDEVAAYNCAFLAINRVEAFKEAMYVLMCGVGVGFSVERQHVSKLPVIPVLHKSDEVIVVEDSKYGWADALHELLSSLYDGRIPSWDVSKVRPAGAQLKTFGGRASGPGPLVALFEYVVAAFLSAQGRKLRTKQAHGIMCKIGDVVVVGGVRRSAEISLSDADDEEMRDAKSGEWYIEHPEFMLANNSAVWHERPERDVFDREWGALAASGSGERGFFNRAAAKARAEAAGRDSDHDFGLNPCGEIILRDRQFCNLSQFTVRANDTDESLREKAVLTTVLGVIQSTFTNFHYLSDAWKDNCEEERLIGVGMTGVQDSPLLNMRCDYSELAQRLDMLSDVVDETSEEYAELFEINVPAGKRCMKPAGNSTQLVGAFGSGLHTAHGKFIIRRNRSNKNDPVGQLLYYQGVPCEDELFHPDTTWVFSYPMRAPEEAITRADVSAIETLEHWLVYSEHWTDHNPSVTVNVRAHEWDEVADWVYKHFDRMVGVSFLPYDDHVYEQAPYEEITEDQYDSLLAEMPQQIDWSLLMHLENSDQTTGSQELACVAGQCEV